MQTSTLNFTYGEKLCFPTFKMYWTDYQTDGWIELIWSMLLDQQNNNDNKPMAMSNACKNFL